VTDQGEGALAVVFLHCWGGSTRTWDRVIDALPPGYRAVAIDQRGWGASEHPADGFSVADLADDTEGVINALGLSRYILVGHSMGGKTAQLLASRRPKGLTGLVLVAPAPPSPLGIPDETRAAMSGLDVSAFVTRAVAQMLTHKPLSDADVELMVADAMRASPVARTAWPHQTSREDITDAVGHIDVPTLVISGEQDKVDQVEHLRRELLPRISGAVLQVLPNVGHLSPLEAPKEIAHHLDAFARNLRSQRATSNEQTAPQQIDQLKAGPFKE
jgi:pimeloyl-ACP methyl ester carboxylesterase